MLLNWWKYQQPAKHLWKRLPFECCLLVGNTVLFGDLKSVSNRKAVECQIKHLFSYCSGNNPEFATWQTYFKCVFFFFSLTLRQQFLSSLCSECPLILLQMSLYRGYCGHWCSHMQQDEAAWYRNGTIFIYGF